MLIQRSSFSLLTHKYWTQTTLQRDKNCPVCDQQTKIQLLINFQFNSKTITCEYLKNSPLIKQQQPSIIPKVLQIPSSHQVTHKLEKLSNVQFLFTVIQKLPFLMNEIRTKKSFSSISNNCSAFTNKKHQHLRFYTPRDPRLRFIINKHSELSEYLYNYGELIGGIKSS